MNFNEALIWLCQNPESVLLRGQRQPITLSRSSVLMQLAPNGPTYARIHIQDIIAADWQGMAIDAFVQQCEQMKQAG